MVQPAAALQSVADSDSVVDHLFALHLVLWQGFVVVPQQVHSVPKMEAVEYHAHVISWARRNQVITFFATINLAQFPTVQTTLYYFNYNFKLQQIFNT